jgi:hypothetical protein
MLRYRAVVSDDAPAFKLIRDTILEFNPSVEYSQQDLRVILTNTLSGLQTIFGKSSSPTDLNQQGDSIGTVSSPELHLPVFLIEAVDHDAHPLGFV